MRNMHLTEEQREQIKKQQMLLEQDQHERRRDYLRQLMMRQQHEHHQHSVVKHSVVAAQQNDVFHVAAAAAAATAFTNSYSLDFDGSDDQLIADADTTNSSPINDLTDKATIALWGKIADQSGTVMWVANQNAFVGGKPFANRYLQMQARADTNKLLFHCVTSAGAVTEFVSSETLGDGNWHHYCMTWDGSTVRYYLDGSSTGSDDSLAGTLDDLSGKPLRHVEFSRKGYYSDKIAGNLDEAAIWNVALSDADVTAIYNSGAPNDLTSADSYDTDRTGNLIGYWRMGDGTEAAAGSTVYDMSGIANTLDLTMENMADSDYETDVPS